MKNKEELIKSQGKLTPSEIDNVQGIVEQLEKFIENEDVDEFGLILLENIQDSFSTLKRTYISRVVSLLKQGHMLD
tara:strand:+ start:148 stop:375 length:228 start_codon:yes stop_codon:yes gene_type:complete